MLRLDPACPICDGAGVTRWHRLPCPICDPKGLAVAKTAKPPAKRRGKRKEIR